MRKRRMIFKEYWDKIPKWLQECIDFLSSLASVIGVVYVAAKAILKILTSIFQRLNLSLPWIMCGILLVIVMLMRFKLKQYKTNSWVRLDSISKGYYKFLHDYRNFYFEILLNYKMKNLNQKYLTELTCNFLRNMLDEMCAIYAAYSGSKMNACIKLIGKENEDVNFDKIDKDNATVYTFLRSSNLTKKREDASNNKAVLIKENTDFSFIIDPPLFYNKQYFYEQDIQLFDEYLHKQGEKYHNTTPNYDEYYKAALLVPIRIAYRRLYFTQQNDKWDYHIVGFLCVDTLSTQAFIPEFEEQFIEIAKSFASITYIVMNKYMFYLTKCRNGYKKRTIQSPDYRNGGKTIC